MKRPDIQAIWMYARLGDDSSFLKELAILVTKAKLKGKQDGLLLRKEAIDESIANEG